MNKIGRKIFYDKINGNIIIDKGEMQGGVVEETIDEIIPKFTTLSERNRETFDVLELPFGAYQQDFAESNGYRVNVNTKALEFSYPDPNAPDVEQPHRVPMSEQIAELKVENELLKTESAGLKERDASLQDDINFIFETMGT